MAYVPQLDIHQKHVFRLYMANINHGWSKFIHCSNSHPQNVGALNLSETAEFLRIPKTGCVFWDDLENK